MSKKRGFRLITMLTVCILLVGSFSMTAFAYADDTDQNLPVTEATQPEETPQPEPTASIEKPSDGEPIDDEATPTPVICSMIRQRTSSSLPSKPKTATLSTLSLTTMRPSMRKRNSIKPIS